ncbi:MAG TPA: hypothetical protein VFC10_13795 [Terriglobia bacterium]|nr:hypothetical protein [Terriglobia bacterium]
MKIKDRVVEMGQNEAKNEVEKVLKINGRGKNEPERCRHRSWPTY